MNNKILDENVKNVHFIGIGGISMSGLAEILHHNGLAVTGSDWEASDITDNLSELGIKIFIGHDEANISAEHDLVVYTAAVKPDNPELYAARKNNIPAMERAKLLGLIIGGYKHSVGVAGMHGKTSTTAIISDVLLTAGLDPTISVGGFMESVNCNYRIGDSQFLVAEACEYSDSFLHFHPFVGVILNIDSDHLDYFGTMDNIVASFCKYAKNIPAEGSLVIHGDTLYIDKVLDGLTCNVITYGRQGSDFEAANISYNEDGYPNFDIICKGVKMGNVSLKLRGTHNIDNALAATAVAAALALPVDDILKGLESASGVKRRYEHKGSFNGITVIDDYAHHPEEIKPNLSAAAKGPFKRIICAFQSHTYSRTQNLLHEFSTAFDYCHTVLVLPVYASREVFAGHKENPIAKELSERINKNGIRSHYMESFESAANWIKKHMEKGDLLITMGAGDINKLGEGLLSGEY